MLAVAIRPVEHPQDGDGLTRRRAFLPRDLNGRARVLVEQARRRRSGEHVRVPPVAVELELCRRVAADLVERSYRFGSGSPGRSGGHLAGAVTRLPTCALQATRGGLYDARTMTDLPTVLPN
jgi:hypothetical protein